MFSLRIKFLAIASKLKISHLTASDLNETTLLEVAQKYLPKRVKLALEKRSDLNDFATLWEILGIHGVIGLENQEGEIIRIGVCLCDSEGKGQNILYDLKGKQYTLVRNALKIKQYWVFVVKNKNFPEEEEWIDILYREIDESPTNSGCRLIIL
ncbi:hypothetical protein [Geminocystis sp. GBBB08]|uniref:hypothetical protein n=1 Tax=Geminocystis sp. GBBB08 TaxID=2604140 RepID=UPI0027E2D7ED|nr:hypothetical protein [Geminocystis sp. GBBB08]MBL1210346.1 hypothetical protein [Geminocystis sp. GBBB08]